MTDTSRMPLSGLKVVELATVVAAPTAGRMLCAYGAEVIKVETLYGDEMRLAGEWEQVICQGSKNPLFTIQNSGKTLTSINLKTPEGIDAFHRLLSWADILLTNVRMPSLRRLGLDYDTLHEKYPRLIYAHFSGFGLEGPDAAKPGFDSTAFWLRNGPLADWQEPGAFPFTPTYAFGDMATSSLLFSGILMAVIGRERSGKGTLVSTSLQASGIWCNAIGVVSHQEQFAGDRVNDPLCPSDPLSHFYKCGDGRWIGIFDNEYSRERAKFAGLLGLPELAEDSRFESLESLRRTGSTRELVEKLNAVFLSRSSGEWLSYLEENNVSCELMHRLSDVSKDPQAIANGYVKPVDFGDDLTVMMPCPPVKFSEYEAREYTPAGLLGQDTDRVFEGLGYSPSEIENMKEAGAIK